MQPPKSSSAVHRSHSACRTLWGCLTSWKCSASRPGWARGVASSEEPRGVDIALSHPRFPAHQVRTEFWDLTVNTYTSYLGINGGGLGPGCSSSKGLLIIDINNISSNGTVWYPDSWNAGTNIFFPEQPSVPNIAETIETDETTEDAAQNVHASWTIFETFCDLKCRPLHLAGRSYGGRYLPAFASCIYDQTQIATYQGHHEKISTCVRMKTAIPSTMPEALQEINRRAANSVCQDPVSGALEHSGRNIYHVTKDCLGDLCYLEVSIPRQPLKRALLVVSSAVPVFSSCAPAAFNARLYNWYATKLWLGKFECMGTEAFRRAGEVTSRSRLPVATVCGAGHLMSISFAASSFFSEADLAFGFAV
ncbi:Alpha/Beta hydrolase protein [Earliella scabrosa]|nr:Alpha/Beta hydrolase protein [Earliella scabrosa]